ncbi:MAG: HAMP domain-containing histidine kinase [Oscillospiraceae bacterium]|nr:HAMP domain-containing histidine kinase [Oscillospiraceae bacterium]
MTREEKYRKFLVAVNHYVCFFLLAAAILTCCMMLFVTILEWTMDIKLTEADLGVAAKYTFGNVVFLSLLCTVIDAIRRKILIDRPVRQITDAARAMMKGDFSVRIDKNRSLDPEDKFNEIISCFNTMAAELEGTETLRTDFIANVSHELKTPLAVMGNYAAMLQQPGITEAQRMEYAKAISDASRRLASLITNILKLNKLENQQIFPTPAVYDLGEQLAACLLDFESLWENKEIEIDVDLEEGVLVKTDAQMLSLVWNNLFSNAIKFTQAHGTVGLRLYTDGDFAVVEVSDTGCGISQEVGRHIFDKFYQGDTSHATQGNGLGLALVKRVIDITGSDIAVASEVGRGTTFTVRIRRAGNGTR